MEQVIMILAGLAAGNRIVGIISHISELKHQIDWLATIKKSDCGSVIRLVK
jgi:exonuclease SbcC